MFKSIVLLMLLSLFMGLAAWLVFIWAVKKGEFEDMEGPKYRMLDDGPDQKSEEKDND